VSARPTPLEPVRLITWSEYMNGRDRAYERWLTLEMGRNARTTIEVVNRVLVAMAADGVELAGVHVSSGWRPPSVNDQTANAAAHSKHLSAEACDLADLPDRRLARWALANFEKLWDAGVRAIERPQWTPSWLHLQTSAPASGRFLFVPSSAPAKVAALPGELEAQRTA
jgi:hypothetical protein